MLLASLPASKPKAQRLLRPMRGGSIVSVACQAQQQNWTEARARHSRPFTKSNFAVHFWTDNWGDKQLATQQRQAAKHKQKTAKDSKTERERETARQTENTRTTCNPSPAKHKRAKEAKGRTKQPHTCTRRSAQRERLRDRGTARLGHVAPQKFDDSH